MEKLIAGERYRLLGSFPRPVAEGLRARLLARGVPVHLETPFGDLPEAYLGTYTGDVSLYVPEALLGVAEAVLSEEAE